MNAQIFYRYCWQLPLLALLCLTMVPDLPWRHAAVGFWPLWLLALPFFAGARSWWTRHRAVPMVRNSQVLVFPVSGKLAGGESRKAA